MDSIQVDALRAELQAISDAAILFFVQAEGTLGSANICHPGGEWERLTDMDRRTAQSLRKKVAEFGVRLLEAVPQSPLLESVDEVDIRRILRSMSAALILREYEYQESYVMSDEDRVLGVRPAQQSEDYASLSRCRGSFRAGVEKLIQKMDFLAPSAANLARAIVSSRVASVHKYRPNTAFIIMQIDGENPKVEDVKGCIKDVFKEYGIDAVRSDEIEHSDVITQRILDEIETSEFLIADLTGERPSVYYEIGYAHALGKRPILYREQGTKLHFDLAVHNVPEYRNITDLKSQLRRRLSALTNKTPQPQKT